MRPAGLSLNGPKLQSDGSITVIGVGATPVVALSPADWVEDVSGEKGASADPMDTAFTPFLRLTQTKCRTAHPGKQKKTNQPRYGTP